jgi:hypothetical protein
MLRKFSLLLFFFFLISIVFAGTVKTISYANSVPDGVLDAGLKSEINTLKETPLDKVANVTVQKAYGKLPLHFIQNDGQIDEKVKFYTKGGGHAIFSTEAGIYLNLIQLQKF